MVAAAAGRIRAHVTLSVHGIKTPRRLGRGADFVTRTSYLDDVRPGGRYFSTRRRSLAKLVV